VVARIAALRQRAEAISDPPAVDGHGRLHFRGGWAQLSPINARLARALSEVFNSVVSEAELFARGWPDASPTSNVLRVHLHRLRRGVQSLGLDVLAVRSEGWVLQLATGDSA
jgi:DNA-binding response OmpR family regulator